MNRITFSWPNGAAGAVTTSWDDGTIHDRRLLEILNRSGLKGTWNLNAGSLAANSEESAAKKRVAREEVKALYAGHEVACHAFNHPFLERIPEEAILGEMVADRRGLEELAGYPVKGMALPYGTYDGRILQRLRAAGIVHSRTTRAMPGFAPPEDFLEWHPTCHHKADLTGLWKTFRECRNPQKLLYVWGHSYEFDNDHNWDHIEAFARAAGPDPSVWHATNMEIYEYVTAWRGLWCSMEMTSVRNPTAVTLWFRAGEELRSCGPGATVAV